MAMKQLVEGECGGPNPLMNMVSHFTQDRAKHQEGVTGWQHRQNQREFHEITEQELVKEYLHGSKYFDTPQTFRMDQLLTEMHAIERHAGPPVMHPIHAGRDPTLDSWVEEFTISQKNAVPEDQWVNEYSRHQVAQVDDLNKSSEYSNAHDKWADEYLENTISKRGDRISNSTLQQTAKEILDKVDDDELKNTNFMKTVENLSKGGSLDDKVDEWVSECEKGQATNADVEAQKWIDEYSLNQQDIEYWKKLQTEWDEITSDDRETEHPWLNQYTAEYKKDYVFEEDNPFKDHPNAFEDGLKKLKEGDLISAILLFEQAVKADPEHAEAWQYLGTSQAENEQESFAISALNKCIELQPNNLTARMSLAVSYTNESLQYQACESLFEWLRHHPRYKNLIPADSVWNRPKSSVSSLMSKDDFDRIHDLFIGAAQQAPSGNIDADVQVGLGILFNLSGEYDKAVDCFHTGIQAQPSDAQIWNKLGATLANSGRSEEAVEAYRNALQLNPAFIRARYNLGISCINLGANTEAAEHFLTALNMQRKGEGPSGVVTTMSDNIWSTFRMVISLLGRSELLPYIQQRNLQELNRAFNMHE